MDAFEIEFSAPVDPSGARPGLGGPNTGGHAGPNWYIRYGMDLGADEGTAVFAAFDAHITRFQPHDPAADSDRVYGAQIFMRAPNDGMGAFFTHLTGTPDTIGVGAVVKRGDFLGTVMSNAGIPPHLHLALVEIVGGLPGGTYQGVDLYRSFLDLQSSPDGTVLAVTFPQDGSAPFPSNQRSAPMPTSTSTSTSTVNPDVSKDLDAADRAFRAASTRRTGKEVPDLLTFVSQISFLTSIGYLTRPQADALVSWFQSHGTEKLPALAGPDGINGPTMYELLTTQIHYFTPRRPATEDEGFLDFFSGVIDAVSGLIETVVDGAVDILHAGTALVQAGTQLVYEVGAVI
jgi:hypothetical protein